MLEKDIQTIDGPNHILITLAVGILLKGSIGIMKSWSKWQW